jgi:8-oxo-dGTP diphosphatase
MVASAGAAEDGHSNEVTDENMTIEPAPAECHSLQETTLCLLVQRSPSPLVLLGLKKEGFGSGKYTGFGGKLEGAETPSAAAIRELEEETGIRVREEDLQPMGQLAFLFPFRPTWSQVVHVFRADRWEGSPREGREMKPVWFRVNCLPLDQMWQDGAYWLPLILEGKGILARFVFQADNETIDEVEIEPWEGGSLGRHGSTVGQAHGRPCP